MIEKTILDGLDSALDVPVYMEIPESVPSSFVLLEKTGSSTENFITASTFAVRSVAPSLFGAATLNESVKEKMAALISNSTICKVTLNSDYNYTDPKTKRYQYQAVFDIVHY